MPISAENDKLNSSAEGQIENATSKIATNLDTTDKSATEKELAKLLKKSILNALKTAPTPLGQIDGGKKVKIKPQQKTTPASPTEEVAPKEGPQISNQTAEPFTAPVETTPEGLPFAPGRADEPSRETVQPQRAVVTEPLSSTPAKEDERQKSFSTQISRDRNRQRLEGSLRQGLGGQSSIEAKTKQTDDTIKKLKRLRRALRISLRTEQGVEACLSLTLILSIFAWLLRLFGFILLSIPILILSLTITILKIKKNLQR